MIPPSTPQRYFPAVCRDGHRPFLTPLVGAQGEALSPRCPACGRRALIVPGAYYDNTQRQYFDQLVDAVQKANLTEAELASTVERLQMLAHQPEPRLREGLLALPKFDGIAPLIPADWQELIRFVSLVAGLLSATAQRTGPEEPHPTTGIRTVEPTTEGDATLPFRTRGSGS